MDRQGVAVMLKETEWRLMLRLLGQGLDSAVKKIENCNLHTPACDQLITVRRFSKLLCSSDKLDDLHSTLGKAGSLVLEGVERAGEVRSLLDFSKKLHIDFSTHANLEAALLVPA